MEGTGEFPSTPLSPPILVTAFEGEGDGPSFPLHPPEEMSSEEKVKFLEQALEDMGTDFGTKRAKFRELFLRKEEELEMEKLAKEELLAEVKRLQSEVNQSRNELGTLNSKNSDLEMEKGKLQNDLLRAARNRTEMEEEWSRLSHDFQSKLASLEEQIGTYEVVLLELNTSCQQSTEVMERNIRRLTIERDSIQKKIEKIETENDILKGKHVAHSQQLQNEYISLPNTVMDLQEMVLRLKEELICIKVGKEQIESQFKFLKDQMKMLEEERSSVEDNLNAEIGVVRDKVQDLTGRLFKNEEERKRLDKNIADLKNKLLASETQINKLHQTKKENVELLKEKETLHNEIQELNNKVSMLRKELTNSEELQRDLISLTKSLQVNLESIRQADSEVRWQFPDDITECPSCRKQFGSVKEKHHCKHCGRIFCTTCISRTVKRGNRDYNVCDVCHTLLAHDSAPYFSTVPPHSPD